MADQRSGYPRRAARFGRGPARGRGIRGRFRPSLDHLEERRLLASGNGLDPGGITVGRTLSATSLAELNGDALRITYTVYNETADPVSGVLLTTGLASGVTLASASSPPNQDGAELAWSLGTIAAFDRASVTMTVVLSGSVAGPIDTGAHAYGNQLTATLADDAPPAVLRTEAIPAGLLASTPDANTTDPYIQEAAAALDYDPQAIFDFLQQSVGYESYAGSVRGARGTLWSLAGNALDVASLGVALMRASGIPAQYAQGTLSDTQAQALIVSMFPQRDQVLGLVSLGEETTDPANDPRLLSEARDHTWFQFDPGTGMRDADPLIPGSGIGQAFTARTSTFDEVPDALREKTRVQVLAELTNPSPLFGPSGPSEPMVALDLTFNDVDLVGHPLTVGNFEASQTTGFLITATTYTYTPFIALGDVASPDPSHDHTMTGSPFQEVFTNFPFGSQILTGLFLTVTLSGP